MKISLLWSGQFYRSLENCLISIIDSGTEVNSVIVGMYEDKIFRAEYFIKANTNWEVVFCEIKNQFVNETTHFSLQSDGKGNWMMNGEYAQQFSGCIDVDISLTPFTNTLPINRLKLTQKEGHLIKVVYIDILEQQIKSLQQHYARLSETEYKYENVPNDFEAVITIDEVGLVVNYPGLFQRTAVQKMNDDK